MKNLSKYNKNILTSETLRNLIMYNIIDMKNANEKIDILNSLDSNDLSDKIKKVIQTYIRKYTVSVDGDKYMYISDYDNKTSNRIRLLKKDDDLWSEINIDSLSTSEQNKINNKYKININDY